VNRWKIPQALEAEIRARDQACIYCGGIFAAASKRGERMSWEHIINDEALVNRENIALCCISCNSSKGTKELSAWLETMYCRNRGIHPSTIAPIAQAAYRAALSSQHSAA
jgi:hypothetical protein